VRGEPLGFFSLLAGAFGKNNQMELECENGVSQTGQILIGLATKQCAKIKGG